LYRLIKKRIKDKRLLGLIKQTLKAGYLEDGVVNKPGYGLPAVGTPQGSIISPLYANIYLHELDKWFDLNYDNGLTPYQKKKRRQAGLGNAKLIRFADDFVILWNGVRKSRDIKEAETAVDAETMKAQVEQFLRTELSLELSSEKTVITHANSGFSFLGFQIKRYRTKNGYQTLTSVPDHKISKFKQKIQMVTRSKGAVFESTAHKIMAINKIINGWAEYYKYTNWKGKQTPARMDYYINERMFRWAKRKHDKLPYTTVIRMYKHRQKGIRIDGRVVDRWNFGFKTQASFVTDEEIIWLAKLEDKPTEKYLPKKKLNPFLTYQYQVEQQNNLLDKWEGRGGNHPYINDLYFQNRKLALKRDNYQCRRCGKEITLGRDTHCHHLDGNSRNHEISNLVTLCIECHYQTYKEHELTL
jgi:hypothetical protein